MRLAAIGLFAFLSLALSTEAHALRRVHLVDESLSFGGSSLTVAQDEDDAPVSGVNLGIQGLHADEGGGGGTGDYIFQGCASIATSVLASLVVGLVVVAAIMGAYAANPNDPAALQGMSTAATIGAVVGILLIPFLSSAVVTMLARGTGAPANYWATVGTSFLARLVLGVIGMFLFPSKLDANGQIDTTGSTVWGVVSGILAAGAEVYAANNFGGGGGSDVPDRKQMIQARSDVQRATRAASDKAQANEAVAPTANVFALAF